MFGISLYERSVKILKNNFGLTNVVKAQESNLKDIVEETKRLNLNEYDAAIMFILVQIKELAVADDQEAIYLLSPSEDQIRSFINVQVKNVYAVMALAKAPKDSIVKAINKVTEKYK